VAAAICAQCAQRLGEATLFVATGEREQLLELIHEDQQSIAATHRLVDRAIEATPVQVDPPPWSRGVMVLREGVQRYNGGNAFRARGQVVTLAKGTTAIEVTWERAGNGYHERVLGPLTP
jgi:hypothetical protein